MKPNPEQAADMAAFEKWLDAPNNSWEDDPLSVGYIQMEAWQAAKADSRAMQDAFEQVCAKLDKINGIMCITSNRYIKLMRSYMPGFMYTLDEVIALASPFRKTGV